MLKDILISRREELRLSIRQASAKIGISHSYLAALERGTDTRGLPALAPTPDTLRLISAGYDMPYRQLMESCAYLTQSDSIDASEISEESPDIRIIARACQRMTTEQVSEMTQYARTMFPEAFAEDI